MPFQHVPFLARYTSSRAKGNEAGMWVCDTVCVWADVCIKTNKKSIKGNIPALLQKHEEASIERGRQWLQCLTTELLSGHKGPLVPPPPSMGVCPEWASVCREEHGDLGEMRENPLNHLHQSLWLSSDLWPAYPTHPLLFTHNCGKIYLQTVYYSLCFAAIDLAMWSTRSKQCFTEQCWNIQLSQLFISFYSPM